MAKINHPLGPDVEPGDIVLVLRRAGGQKIPGLGLGKVLPPGYKLELALTKAEPTMRVIAVEMLGIFSIIDATSWAVSPHGKD